jgi:hypothetical protein
VEIRGLNRLLRALSRYPKEASAELREASQDIASRLMAPAWKAAAGEAGPWGAKLAESVRAKRDRVPAVSIGYARKAYSGGASTNQLRYPTHHGTVERSASPYADKMRRTYWSAFSDTQWMRGVKRRYIGPAMDEWGDAVERTVRKWNAGGGA